MLISPKDVRKIIVDLAKKANVGHIGSALSVVEILVSLYSDVLPGLSYEDKDRDRVILSKGHASLALYAVLFLKGWICESELYSYCQDGSPLGVHPEHMVNGIDFSTGSLGHGLAIGAGAALAARFQKSHRKAFVILSDAECNEGSTWETIMFAHHHRLSNLIAIVDLNGQQAYGYTKDVINLDPLAERFKSFGWNVVEANGHDVKTIGSALKNFQEEDRPHVLIAKTTFGKGVSFMENQIPWHYLPLSDSDYQKALDEIG